MKKSDFLPIFWVLIWRRKNFKRCFLASYWLWGLSLQMLCFLTLFAHMLFSFQLLFWENWKVLILWDFVQPIQHFLIFIFFRKRKKIVVKYGEKIKSPFFTHKIVKKIILLLISNFPYFFPFLPIFAEKD